LRNKKKIILSIIAFLFVLCGVVAFAVYSAYKSNVYNSNFKTIVAEGVKEDPQNKERLNVLVLGMEHTRTDTIMVATFDPVSKTLNIISIPRDTYVDRSEYPDYYPYNTYKKINALYELPTTEGGVERLASKVSEILGIPIHDYIMVSYDAVADITDAVGGVDVEIKHPMYYDDPWSDPPLHVNFSVGTAHLDGKNAIEYLRWRHNNDGSYGNEGDEGRVKRQQGFLKKVLEKALNPTVFPKLVEATFKNVKTSLELGKAMSLASDVTSMPKENIRFYQEVGTPAYFNGLWYYLLDANKTTALMSKIMNNETITDEDINPSQEFENSALAKGNSENYNSGNSSYKEYNYTPTKKRKKVEDTKLEEAPIFNEQNNQNKNKLDDAIINNNTGEQQNQNKQNADGQTNPDGSTQNPDGTSTDNQGQNQQNQGEIKQNQNNQNTGTSGENSQNKDNSNKDNSNKDNSNKDNTTKTPANNEGGNSNQNPTTPSQPETPTTPPKDGGEGGDGEAPIF
jgi:putative uncharacterized protein lytR